MWGFFGRPGVASFRGGAVMALVLAGIGVAAERLDLVRAFDSKSSACSTTVPTVLGGRP